MEKERLGATALMYACQQGREQDAMEIIKKKVPDMHQIKENWELKLFFKCPSGRFFVLFTHEL
jgi:hypothetical protein